MVDMNHISDAATNLKILKEKKMQMEALPLKINP
jgi:hypothetical protein